MICKEWFNKNFVPAAKAHADPTKPILLIYDGHGSHSTLEMIDSALENNIILYLLPPHTTHHLQPCDVGAFGPLKRAWHARCDEIYEKTGQPMQASDVPREYMAVRATSFKESTIRKAWEKSGISTDENGRPKCTPKIFAAADYAPSFSSSTQLHLPDGFPSAREPAPEPVSSDSSDSGSDDETDSDKNDLDSDTLPPTRRSTRIHQDSYGNTSDSDSESDPSHDALAKISTRVQRLQAKAKKYRHQ